MKIRDGNTFKELKMKAEVLDTLPINSVVDYEGDTVPEGWEEVVDNGECIVSATEPQDNDRKKVWLQHRENLFDGILELGDINGSTGQEIESTTSMRCKNYIDVKDLSSVSYNRNPEVGAFYIVGYDNNKNYLGIVGTNVSSCSYIRFTNPNNANLNTKIKIEPGSNMLPDKTYILDSRDTYEEFKTIEQYTLLGETNITATGSVDVFTFNPNLYKRIIYRCGSNEEGDSGTFEIINGVILNPVIHFYNYADAGYNISGYVKIITSSTTNTMVIRTRQMTGWPAINFKFYGIKI